MMMLIMYNDPDDESGRPTNLRKRNRFCITYLLKLNNYPKGNSMEFIEIG